MRSRYSCGLLAAIVLVFTSIAGAARHPTQPTEALGAGGDQVLERSAAPGEAGVPATLAGRHHERGPHSQDDESDDESDDSPCSDTAATVFKACKAEITDDFWIAIANCINGDAAEQEACNDDAREERASVREECEEQRDAREDLCDALGQERYDPEFDPDDFETEFDNQNSYWPLKVGNSWVFEGADETITVEVLDETKLIEGVTCIVVRDVVVGDGQLVEDTDDWYAQATNGDVWYVGEIAQNFETFEGDDPEDAELVDIEGSWKTARDDAKPGITMFASPEVGTFYRQEVAWGDAEDAAEVLANDYGYGNDPELDFMVPELLADLLCDDDCVVTREFTPVEPGVEALKYYSPLVGVFLEVEDGEIVVLTECDVSVHPVCADIPGL